MLVRFMRPFRAAGSKLPFFFATCPQLNASKKLLSKSVKAERRLAADRLVCGPPWLVAADVKRAFEMF